MDDVALDDPTPVEAVKLLKKKGVLFGGIMEENEVTHHSKKNPK